MCGGVREFESLRAPDPQMISLLLAEIRQCSPHDYGNELSYVPESKPFTSHQVIDKSRPDQPPDGLAIVAVAIGSDHHELQLQSPAAATSALAPIRKPHDSAYQEQPFAPQTQSPASAREPRVLGQVATTGYGSSIVVPKSRKCEEKKPKRKSIFCSAFSPPKEYIRVRESPPADFMGACFLCQRHLGAGNDIFIYRGERAFCSNECRYQHIVEDERSECLQKQANLPASNDANSKGEAAHCKNRIPGASPAIPVLG